jgi:hypothetical protein
VECARGEGVEVSSEVCTGAGGEVGAGVEEIGEVGEGGIEVSADVL